jgi:hypothetical protein
MRAGREVARMDDAPSSRAGQRQGNKLEHLAMETTRWRKSTFSGYHECVELAHTLRAVRDSKNPNGPVLAANMNGFLAAVKRGELDR